MIILKPTIKIRKRFPNLDFETLSLVYSLLFDSVYKAQKKRSYTLYIKFVKKNYSYYTFQPGKFVYIKMSGIIFNEKNFHSTLLHEFRHFVQDKVFRIPLTKKNYDETTLKSYLSSPVEADADWFEMHTTPKVIRLYKRLFKLKSLLAKDCVYIGNKIK
jgi:hypothetical protein